MVSYKGAAVASSIPELVRTMLLLLLRRAVGRLFGRCWQAFASRKLAVEEVEKLLQRPEDLNRLNALLDEYRNKHQVPLDNSLYASFVIKYAT